jgi:hypothetical protein
MNDETGRKFRPRLYICPICGIVEIIFVDCLNLHEIISSGCRCGRDMLVLKKSDWQYQEIKKMLEEVVS